MLDLHADKLVALQILIAVVVTLWINWAHFMTWASSNGQEMMLAAQGLAGREDRCALQPYMLDLLCRHLRV